MEAIMKIREGKNVEKVWLKHYEDLVSKEIDNPDLLLTDYLETMAKNTLTVHQPFSWGPS